MGGCPGCVDAETAATAAADLSVHSKTAAGTRAAGAPTALLPAATAASLHTSAAAGAAAGTPSCKSRRRRQAGSTAAPAETIMRHGTIENEGSGGGGGEAAAGVVSEEAGAATEASACTQAAKTEVAATAAAAKDEDSSVAAILRRAEEASAKGKLLLFVVRLKERGEHQQQQKRQQQQQERQPPQQDRQQQQQEQQQQQDEQKLQDARAQQQQELQRQRRLPEPGGQPRESQQLQQQHREALGVNLPLQRVTPSYVTDNTLVLVPAAADSTGTDRSAAAPAAAASHANAEAPTGVEAEEAAAAAAACAAGSGSRGCDEHSPVDIEDITQYLDPPSSPPRHFAAAGIVLNELQSPESSDSSSYHSSRSSSSCHISSRRRSSRSSSKESSDCCISCSNGGRINGFGVLEDVSSSSSASAASSSSVKSAAASALDVSHLRAQQTEGREHGGRGRGRGGREAKERKQNDEEGDATKRTAVEESNATQWVPLHAKPLPSVTDFSAQLWCEQQLQYTLQTGIRRETVAMKKGVARHLALELLHHDLESVYVDTEEEVVAFKLLNTIRQLQQLQQKGLCREVWVFGFLRDTAVRGVIDELRITRISPPPFTSPLSPLPAPRGGPAPAVAAAAAAVAAASAGGVAVCAAGAAAAGSDANDAKEGKREEEAEAAGQARTSLRGTGGSGRRPPGSGRGGGEGGTAAGKSGEGNASAAAVAVGAGERNREGFYVLVSDNKTRSVKKAPPMAQKRSSALQLQVYWHLLQQLREEEVPLQAFLDAFGLRAQLRVQNPLLLAAASKAGVNLPPLLSRDASADGCRDVTTAAAAETETGAAAAEREVAAAHAAGRAAAHEEKEAAAAIAGGTAASGGATATEPDATAAEAEQKPAAREGDDEDLLRYEREIYAADLLQKLLVKLQEELQLLPPLWKDVHVVYECDGEEFLREEIPCHAASLLHSLDDMLGWWKGHRAAEPVQPMEKWKCRSCVFLKDCNASPLDTEERAAALAAQEEAAEAEKRALEEFEESTNAGASGAALQAERQQQAEHEQMPLQPQRDSQRQSEQLLEKQEEMRQKDRDTWSSLSSPATPARQTLLQQRQGTGDMEQLSHQGPSFRSRFVRVQSSEPCTQSLKQVTTEQHQQHPAGRGLQPQHAEEQGSHSVHRYRQQQHQGHPQQEQRSQNQRLHTFVFPLAARTTATQLAGRSAAPVAFSPAGTAHDTSRVCNRDAYSSPRKNISAIGADGLSFSSAARQGARESDIRTARAAAAGARDADAYRPAARAMQAIAAAATTSDAGHNPRGVPRETVLHFNARAACSTQFVAPTTPECSVNRDARRTCGVVDVPSSASFLGSRANAQGKCARGFGHNSDSTAARGNSAHLLSGSFAAVAGGDANGKFGETQNLLAAQRKPPAVAALQLLSPQETAPPAASASPSPEGAAFVADSRCAILTSQTPANDSVPSAAATTLFPAAALASRETVFPESQGEPAGSSGSRGDSVGDAAGPLAGTGNNEEAARAAATGTTIGPAEAASEARNMRMKQLPTAAIGKHERHGSVFPSGTFSQVPVRPNFPTSCCSTSNMNGRSSSQSNLNSSRASFVTPAKRSRSLATGSAAGGAATAVGEKQPATLKSREGHAGVIKRQLSSSDQRQKDPREQRQLPRRTSSFPIAVSKHQTQIIRYFTAERSAS